MGPEESRVLGDGLHGCQAGPDQLLGGSRTCRTTQPNHTHVAHTQYTTPACIRHFNTNPCSREVLPILCPVTDQAQERLTYSSAQTGVTDVYGGGMGLQNITVRETGHRRGLEEYFPRLQRAC